jgi:hypothetical protein
LEHSDYSRTTIYSHAQRVVEAAANEQATGVSYEALWAENEALWQVWSETETRSEAKHSQPCHAMRLSPLSTPAQPLHL